MLSNLRISIRRKNKKKSGELEVRPLPPSLAKIAEAELNEDPKRTASDVESIREWLEKQPHLTARTDDQFIVSYLRGSKFSLEKAKEKIDTYYAYRYACPDIYGNRDVLDAKIQYMLDQGVVVPLPEPHPNGTRILFTRPFQYDPQKYTISDQFKLSFMIGDTLLMEDDHTAVAGITNLVDLKGMSMSHASQLTPVFLKKVATATQDAYPTRVKAVHYINVPPIFEMIFKIFSQFISSKIKKRIYMHSSMDSLYNYIPSHLLPKEYGGEKYSFDEIKEKLRADLLAKRDWFLEDMQYKSNEEKRPGKSKNSDLLFGVEGSFRKLEFD